ncbi:rhodanese-like domain-containing protein [Yoonia vestfoldensis]|uniref:rhodanese-like domain-containing protein n=1 Tax=Yoonia vestfoldensis TaxID=245188 RepID=UPI0003A9279C|nr:rhodanese-like domain-containing protein [Yoonia vestfoldensis]
MSMTSRKFRPTTMLSGRLQTLATRILAVVGAALLTTGAVSAQGVNITPDLPYFEFDTGRDFLVIERNQNPEARTPDFFTMTSRQCPPFCIQPMSGGEGVTTVGELEVLDFMREHVANGTGHIIDARLSEWFERGTIPGAINLSFTLFDNPEDNPFIVPVLTALGGTQATDGTWDLTEARELVLFCNGPWCGQSHQALDNLLKIGYPAEKLRYYRGGMQGWVSLGLTVEVIGQ